MLRSLRSFLHSGYVHRQDLLDAGWRPDRIRRAAREEDLEIIRRTWIVAREAHPLIIAAAHSGGILTCVSAFELAGAWRPSGDASLHVHLPSHSGARVPGDVRVHRGAGPKPRATRQLADHIENALAAVATCVPYEDARAVWESSLTRGLVTTDRLERIAWRGDRARRLRDSVTTLSDSGLETRFVVRLERVGVRPRQQVRIAGRPVDLLIGSWLVVQIDGFAHHSDPRQRRSDIAHDRALRALGYTVFRYDYVEVMHEWPRVEAEILAAIAQRIHLRDRRSAS